MNPCERLSCFAFVMAFLRVSYIFCLKFQFFPLKKTGFHATISWQEIELPNKEYYFYKKYVCTGFEFCSILNPGGEPPREKKS